MKWLNLHPQLADNFGKINNEGKRTMQQGYNLKLMGLRPGMTDLFIYYPNKSRTHAGLWLEVKRAMNYPPSSRKSDTWVAQELFIAQVKKVGFWGCMCYGWVDGKNIIENYLDS